MENIKRFIKDKVNKKVLWTLSDGRAYTLIELATYAEGTRKQVENIIQQLIQHDWMVMEKHRFCYYKLKNNSIVETFNSYLYPEMKDIRRIYPKESPLPELKYCRSCHGHLAGKVGVKVTEAIQKSGLLYPKRVGKEYIFEITEGGRVFFEKLGLDIDNVQQKSGKFAKACLDFSERKHHLGGRLGVAFLEKLIENNWIEKQRNSRVKVLTDLGKQKLSQLLEIEWEDEPELEPELMRMS